MRGSHKFDLIKLRRVTSRDCRSKQVTQTVRKTKFSDFTVQNWLVNLTFLIQLYLLLDMSCVGFCYVAIRYIYSSVVAVVRCFLAGLCFRFVSCFIRYTALFLVFGAFHFLFSQPSSGDVLSCNLILLYTIRRLFHSFLSAAEHFTSSLAITSINPRDVFFS